MTAHLSAPRRSQSRIAAIGFASLMLLGAALAADAPKGQPSKAEPPKPDPKNEKKIEEIVAWINDEVVTYTELRDAEQAAVADQFEGKRPSAQEMSDAITQARGHILGDLITARLLVQQAEQLFDMDAVKKDLLDRFKERQKVRSESEIENILKQYDMSRDDLMKRLILDSVPRSVISNQVTNQLGISEADSRAWYQAHIEKFTSPASVTFRELLLAATTPEQLAAKKPEAEALLAKARGGDDFEQMIKLRSDAASKSAGGLIGPLDPRDLRSDLKDALAAGTPGSFTLVSSPSGWTLIKLEGRVDVRVQPFEEVKDECEESARNEKFEPQVDAYVAGLWRGATVEVRKEYFDRLPAKFSSLVKQL